MFAATLFRKQKRREMLVSHLPAVTHPSVKHVLLTTPSSDTFFTEEVIRDSLPQVREDSHLTLLKNFSSGKGGKGSALSSSTSSQWTLYSSSAAPSSLSSFTKSPRGTKQPSSSSLARRSKVGFKGVPRSPWKKNFQK